MISSQVYQNSLFNFDLDYTKILEINLFAFAYRLFHRDFSPVNGTGSDLDYLDLKPCFSLSLMCLFIAGIQVNTLVSFYVD